jgi:hypothetical protein
VNIEHEELIERGWRTCKTPDGGLVYSKPGRYGWFSAAGAWYYEADLAAGLVEQQYPSELMPPAPMLSSTLTERPPLDRGSDAGK